MSKVFTAGKRYAGGGTVDGRSISLFWGHAGASARRPLSLGYGMFVLREKTVEKRMGKRKEKRRQSCYDEAGFAVRWGYTRQSRASVGFETRIRRKLRKTGDGGSCQNPTAGREVSDCRGSSVSTREKCSYRTTNATVARPPVKSKKGTHLGWRFEE